MARIRFENLSFWYPQSVTPALSDVSFSLESGEYLCVCGKSGSGKTTLLRQLKPLFGDQGRREGVVIYDNTPLEDVLPEKQASSIGFISQDPDAQIVTDTVGHEMAFGLECLGMSPEVIEQRIAETASFFGMQAWFNDPISAMSGGQKQLLNLASALALQPEVLVLDEPTSQLDPIAATRFLTMLRRINGELGISIVLSEQRLEEAFPDAHRAMVLDGGRVAAFGTPDQVTRKLFESEDVMKAALPTPARVYGAVEGSSGERDVPLTIREGRTWLEGFVSSHDVKARIESPENRSSEHDVVLRSRDLWFRYERSGRDVVQGVDLELRGGRIFAVVGPNGAGKTTLLQCLCGLARPSRGSVQVMGERLFKGGRRTAAADAMGMLPQDPKLLFARETVREELMEMLEACCDEGKRERRVNEIVDACAIAALLDANPFDLSGGEQQRVALAKVLLAQPRVLLLDEPTKGMDAVFKQSFAQILRELRERGAAILVVSHDLEFCARCADDAAMLFNGSLSSATDARAFFSENAFYTTAASRMSRGIFENAITDEDLVALCRA